MAADPVADASYSLLGPPFDVGRAIAYRQQRMIARLIGTGTTGMELAVSLRW
jgi:hypothetical protein